MRHSHCRRRRATGRWLPPSPTSLAPPPAEAHSPWLVRPPRPQRHRRTVCSTSPTARPACAPPASLRCRRPERPTSSSARRSNRPAAAGKRRSTQPRSHRTRRPLFTPAPACTTRSRRRPVCRSTATSPRPRRMRSKRGEEEHLLDLEWARHLAYDQVADAVNRAATAGPASGATSDEARQAAMFQRPLGGARQGALAGRHRSDHTLASRLRPTRRGDTGARPAQPLAQHQHRDRDGAGGQAQLHVPVSDELRRYIAGRRRSASTSPILSSMPAISRWPANHLAPALPARTHSASRPTSQWAQCAGRLRAEPKRPGNGRDGRRPGCGETIAS